MPATRTNSKIGWTEPNGHGAKHTEREDHRFHDGVESADKAPVRRRHGGQWRNDRGHGGDVELGRRSDEPAHGWPGASKIGLSKRVAGIHVGEVPVTKQQGFIAIGFLQTASAQRTTEPDARWRLGRADRPPRRERRSRAPATAPIPPRPTRWLQRKKSESEACARFRSPKVKSILGQGAQTTAHGC